MAARRIREPTHLCTSSLGVLLNLCQRMRPDEVDQYEALTGKEFEPQRAAVEMFSSGQCRYAIHDGTGLPVVAGGYDPVVPGVWQSWMVGTMDGWAKHWREIHQATRWMIQEMMDAKDPETGEPVVRRLQTNALASRAEACAWYLRLGMKFEGTMRGFGMNGEDVAMYSLTRQDWEAANGRGQ